MPAKGEALFTFLIEHMLGQSQGSWRSISKNNAGDRAFGEPTASNAGCAALLRGMMRGADEGAVEAARIAAVFALAQKKNGGRGRPHVSHGVTDNTIARASAWSPRTGSTPAFSRARRTGEPKGAAGRQRQDEGPLPGENMESAKP